MKIKPMKDRVVIQPKETSDRTVGGLYIPETAKEKTLEAEVVAVWDDKDCPLKAGDKILYEKYSGTEINIKEEKFLVINIKDVLAKIE